MIEISESNYSEIMGREVEPYLKRHGTEGTFPGERKLPIHYEMFTLPESKYAVVISHGFTESAEKFHEMSYRLMQMGCDVYAIDHRGHGRSGRHVENTVVTHVEKFDDYIKDLHTFVETVVKKNANGKPLVLFGHSMGGAIAASYLMTYPDDFAKGILNSPMIQCKTGTVPFEVAHGLAVAMSALFQKKKCAMGYKTEFDKDEKFETSCDTSRARFDYYKNKRRKHVHLQNSAPTYGWVRESTGITSKLLRKENVERIKAAMLLLQAENDNMVENEAEKAFAGMAKDCRLVMIPGSKHEIYMSPDPVLENYFRTIGEFIQA